ncbi:ribonuclease catalytic domain-containing protein [Desulfohalobium retbaense]|uniref:Ribonuclease II n=1 Tax=Desulfohalobium retbaense (strain ATCC 49708 / DSM 5692 / JCM 16813 / HR100) TaxID=485915 RepID=C8X572_DESRD|nr:ribonuclease catalytic domain-containing protein [Desulfohalobium retbaense]ACV69569.1 ribonuclease II [Desulfohalobium retbaense DSM 5692]
MRHETQQITSGTVVEFMQSNQPIVAWVVDAQPNRLRVVTINKRESKLPAARVLPWSGPSYTAAASREEFLERLEQHQQRRVQLAAELEPESLWDLVRDDVQRGTARWFAELIWADPDADQIAAMGRALLESKAHFKFVTPNFEIYSEEKVQLRLAEMEAARRRQELIDHGHGFLKALWAKRRGEETVLPELSAELVDQLRQLLQRRMADPEDGETANVWRELRKGLPDDPHLPLRLAQAWGLVPEHYNVLLDRAGYSWGDGWSQAYTQEIERLENVVGEGAGNPEPERFVSIDGASTEDLDDAFFLERDGEGYRLTLALACPVWGWHFGSPLDQAVAERATSLYLPEGASHMLPERLGTGLYSLRAGQTRPALLVDMALDARGSLQEVSPRLGWVRVAENLTYAAVEEAMAGGTAPAMLTEALDLATTLRDRRIRNGAVIIERPEPELVLEDEGQTTRVRLEMKEPTPQAQLVVSEFMILTNRAVAQWANAQGVSLVHRTQDINLGNGSAGIWSDPAQAYQIVRQMGPSKLALAPQPHASLGVNAYVPVTSPLRRYTDFLNMAQIMTFVQSGQARLDAAAFEELLPYLSARQDNVAQIQRFRPRYWKLEYLRQNQDAWWPGIVVEAGPKLITVALPREQVLLRGKRNLFDEPPSVGERLLVRVGKIDPLNNAIELMEVREETWDNSCLQ